MHVIDCPELYPEGKVVNDIDDTSLKPREIFGGIDGADVQEGHAPVPSVKEVDPKQDNVIAIIEELTGIVERYLDRRKITGGEARVHCEQEYH